MGVENANGIHELDSDAPLGTESISEGDNHIRVIKNAIKKTFKSVTGEVTASHTDLNEVPGLVTDVSSMKADVDAIKNRPTGNVASCYYKGGSRLYEYNVSDVGKTPGNNFGTRITFRNALQGPTPSHYSFSITPVSIGGLPTNICVTNVQQAYIDFIALEFQNTGGDWVYMEGTTADFSLIVIDMEAGQ